MQINLLAPMYAEFAALHRNGINHDYHCCLFCVDPTFSPDGYDINAIENKYRGDDRAYYELMRRIERMAEVSRQYQMIANAMGDSLKEDPDPCLSKIWQETVIPTWHRLEYEVAMIASRKDMYSKYVQRRWGYQYNRYVECCDRKAYECTCEKK